jgi:UDPglucose 6-dehydrogenase
VPTAVEVANFGQRRALVDTAVAGFGDDLQERNFALCGLVFKPGTDDLRDAPKRAIMHELLRRGAAMRAYDPVAMDEARRVFGDLPGLNFVSHQADALRDADALLIVTEWRVQEPGLRAGAGAAQAAADLRWPQPLRPALVRSLGLEYHAIGRGEAPRGLALEG